MINKGNILYLFLVYLIVVLNFITNMQKQIEYNLHTLENMEVASIDLISEMQIVNYIKEKLENDEITTGKYSINSQEVYIEFKENTIVVENSNLKFLIIFEIKDNIITSYSFK